MNSLNSLDKDKTVPGPYDDNTSSPNVEASCNPLWSLGNILTKTHHGIDNQNPMNNVQNNQTPESSTVKLHKENQILLMGIDGTGTIKDSKNERLIEVSNKMTGKLEFGDSNVIDSITIKNHIMQSEYYPTNLQLNLSGSMTMRKSNSFLTLQDITCPVNLVMNWTIRRPDDENCPLPSFRLTSSLNTTSQRSRQPSSPLEFQSTFLPGSPPSCLQPITTCDSPPDFHSTTRLNSLPDSECAPGSMVSLPDSQCTPGAVGSLPRYQSTPVPLGSLSVYQSTSALVDSGADYKSTPGSVGSLSDYQYTSGPMDFGFLSDYQSTPGLVDSVTGYQPRRGSVGSLPDYQSRLGPVGSLPDYQSRLGPVGSLPDYQSRLGPVGSLPDYQSPLGSVGSLPDYESPLGSVGSLPDYQSSLGFVGSLLDYQSSLGFLSSLPDNQSTFDPVASLPDYPSSSGSVSSLPDCSLAFAPMGSASEEKLIHPKDFQVDLKQVSPLIWPAQSLLQSSANGNLNLYPNMYSDNQTFGGAEDKFAGGAEDKSDGGAEDKSDGGAELKSDGGAELKSDGGAELKSDGGAEDKSDSGAENISDGGAELKSDGGAELKSDGGAELKSDGGAELKSDGGAELKSDGGAELKSDGGAELKSDGGAELKSDGGAEDKPNGGVDTESVTSISPHSRSDFPNDCLSNSANQLDRVGLHKNGDQWSYRYAVSNLDEAIPDEYKPAATNKRLRYRMLKVVLCKNVIRNVFADSKPLDGKLELCLGSMQSVVQIGF